jgi:TPR repeat protein
MAAQGQGIAQNFTLAAEWFLMAAKKGNAQAQFNLGFLYSHGQGVDEDFIEAYKWYKISDACGYVYAKDSMALLSSKMDEVDVEMADWRGANFLHAFVNEQADEKLIS